MPPVKDRDYTFPDRLAKLMAKAEMSTSDLARSVWGEMTDERGYPVAKNRQSVSKYLSGAAYPGPQIRLKIADALGEPYSAVFPLEKLQDRPGSGVSLTPIGSGKRSKLYVELELPTKVAMQIIALLGDYT